jgi:uncharacterized membrane protein
MLERSRTQALKENATTQMDLAVKLAQDRKFRKQLLSAIGHGAMARQRAARRVGLAAAVGRLSADPKLRRELQQMTTSLQKALGRVEKKRSHKLRNALILVGAGGMAAALAVPGSRRRLLGHLPGEATSPRVIDESIEVGVPVSTAYNQWTQFEDFPLFMEGVDDVRQVGDTRLHWAATVAGRRHEWDAKILEQHPDRQISWISEDGKKTRGSVSFEPRGESKALIRLSMSYQAEGMAEAVGSAAGLDARRIRGDLERFKDLVESRGAETGAWRGEVSAGRSAR